MSENRRSSWLRFAAEGLLIVVSILLALAVNTYWSARQDRAMEGTELMGIEHQLMETKTQLERIVAADELLLEASERLVGILEEAPGGTVSVVDSLLLAQGLLRKIPVDNAFRNLLRERRFFDRVLLARERRTLDRLESLLDQLRKALPESA